MKVDAHQHFWRIADRAGAWPPAELAAIHRDFQPRDLAPLLRGNGIDATVLVQSMPTTDETAALLEIARRTDFVRGVVGWTDLKAGDAREAIATLAREPLLKGLRPMLQDLPEDDWIADPALAPAAEAMARHGLVFDALVMPRHLAALHVFAAAHPGLAIVIDHAAKPFIARGILEPWRTDMARLAALPNVHCKLSGLLTEAEPGAGPRALLPFVQAAWTLFGPRRLLWGSDWPVLRLAADYTAWRALAEALIDAADPPPSDADRAALFGGNAVALYRL